ncbi:hypothetical protein [Raineyella fluvialis]|uniref:Uncharacterized protein n=1 Tax=Raineyella fluvialis TaxID=2662261 RepID=A0A5Q2F6J5_9ACTN|nr:hypothetical protein [Raineyella fluvialis]QGF22600.1 hypothetical protein Rai3103_01680 [Raineyella fluvialis]
MVDLIWATRGRSWGFRFLLFGGYSDPLSAYERAFAGIEDDVEVSRRAEERVALRFLDPLNRVDAAGRIIPHDFVVWGPLADDIHSVEDGIQKVWPLVVDVYARVWMNEKAPVAKEIQSAIDTA